MPLARRPYKMHALIGRWRAHILCNPVQRIPDDFATWDLDAVTCKRCVALMPIPDKAAAPAPPSSTPSP